MLAERPEIVVPVRLEPASFPRSLIAAVTPSGFDVAELALVWHAPSVRELRTIPNLAVAACALNSHVRLGSCRRGG